MNEIPLSKFTLFREGTGGARGYFYPDADTLPHIHVSGTKNEHRRVLIVTRITFKIDNTPTHLRGAITPQGPNQELVLSDDLYQQFPDAVETNWVHALRSIGVNCDAAG